MAKISLKNVRLSFPSVFNRSVFDGKEGKYEATFLLSKSDTATKAVLEKAIAAAMKDANVKVPSSKIFLKDGDDFEYDGYEDVWSIKASANRRPTVINRDKTPLTAEDEVIYAGCYVNASIDLWVQNNNYGKRVNANLYGVQFLKDGDSFGAGPVDATDDFDEIDDEDDDLDIAV